MKFNTKVLHGSYRAEFHAGSTLAPVAQVSAFEQSSAEQMEKVFSNQAPGFAYSRLQNPTVLAFERQIAELEEGVAAVACASGMAAVSMALLNILQAGDEIIATSRLYGGTLSLFHDLEKFGIKTRFASRGEPESCKPLITEKTKLVFTEVISNPGLDVADVEGLAELAHANGIPLIVDNTTATPVLFHPLRHGADVAIHSSSKYINGHGSAISGVIVDGGNFLWDGERWPALKDFCGIPKLAYLSRLRNDIWQHFGPCLAPQNAFLNILGLETIGLRVERECSNALALANALSQLRGIHAVNYPGLETSGSYSRTRLFTGGKAGAILTFRAGSKERAFQIVNHLKYASIVSNIGDVRTLVVHPASSLFIHSGKEERERAGVYDDLIRVSVGIEDIEDLIQDFTEAIEKADQ
ncbi:MAG: O-acetylhomoserine aminocarboxypropyltransferase/cysteine synthase [Oscillospiraceae bacterium]|nr:O-acetylhomoserine aminocarboxypropyltransferase/cysteine synthase [Oscillospiraceae bacterium]